MRVNFLLQGKKKNLDRKGIAFPTEFVLFAMGGFRLCPSGPWAEVRIYKPALVSNMAFSFSSLHAHEDRMRPCLVQDQSRMKLQWISALLLPCGTKSGGHPLMAALSIN